MSRPTTLLKDNTLYWVIRLFNSAGALVDADSTPTINVYKNGADTADIVTVTKRAATTGIYDCSYSPASEVIGDQFTVEESAVISSSTYENSWEIAVVDAASAPTAAAVADAVWDELQSGHVTAGTFGKYLDTEVSGVGGVGSGSTSTVVTIKLSGVAIAGADVWVTTDSAGTTVVAGTLVSDAFGVVTFLLDPGTYYGWAQKAGVNFSAVNPITITVV